MGRGEVNDDRKYLADLAARLTTPVRIMCLRGEILLRQLRQL